MLLEGTSASADGEPNLQLHCTELNYVVLFLVRVLDVLVQTMGNHVDLIKNSKKLQPEGAEHTSESVETLFD